MADNKLQIVITAQDLTSGAFNRVIAATKAYRQTLDGLNGTASAFTGTIVRMAGAIGGFGLFKEAVSSGYRFNSTIEDSKVGLAGLIFSMRDFTDAQGKAASKTDAFSAAMRLSEDVQARLRISGLKTAATYEQLVKAYSQAYVPAIKAGFGEEQIVAFTSRITQAATAMRVPLDMLGEEVRSILTGTMTPRNTILQPLMEIAGLKNEKIRQLSASGKLFDEVMKALEGSQKGADEAAKNLTVRWSNLKDAISQAAGRALEGGFEKTKQIIQDLTDSIVTFDEKTGKINWNENLLAPVRKLDELVFAAVGHLRELSAAIAGFQENYPILSGLAGYAAEIGGALLLSGIALRTFGGLFAWIKSIAVANIVFVVTLFSGFAGTLGGITMASIAAGGALAMLGAFAGVVAAAMAGWQIGKYISQMEIMGLTISEAMQAGYASVAKFGAYAVYTWDMIGATAKSVWGNIKALGRVLLNELLAQIQESFPKIAAFFGLTDNYRAKNDAARAAQKAIYDEFFQSQTAAEVKLKSSLALQENIQQQIFQEADARKTVKTAIDASAYAAGDFTATTKKGTAAAVEYNLAHSAVNQTLDRLSQILTSARDRVAQFASDIRKISATSHDVKLIDIEDAYRKDLADIKKYGDDMASAVRELQEKISKAQKDAAKKNAKRDANDPITAVDPAVLADAQNILKLKQELITNVEILERQAREKRDIAVAQENSGSLASVRSFVAAQTQEYTQLTGNVRAGYKAEANALRAKLAEELADVKKSAEEKAAITLLYNEKIRQAEVVKPAEYDRAAREAELNNRLASLDLIEAEGTAHRNTINERIRLTEELLSLQRQSLAAMPKTGNEQAWNAQMDKIIAGQKARAELMREQLMNSPMEAFKRGFSDLLNEWTDTGKQMYDVAQSTAQAMQQGFSDFFFDAFQGKLQNLADYLNAFLQSVQRALANALSQQMSAGITSGIQGLFSQPAKYDYYDSALGATVTGTQAPIHHGGGEVGAPGGFYRIVPNIAGLIPRRHSGGLAPDERMVINKVGERYVTQEQNEWLTAIAGRMRAGGAGDQGAATAGNRLPDVVVNIDNQGGGEMEAKTTDIRFDHEQLIINVVAKKAKSSPDFRNLLATGGRG